MSAIFAGFGYEHPEGVEFGSLPMDSIVFDAVQSPILPDFNKQPVTERIVTNGADRDAYFRQYTIPKQLVFFGKATVPTIQTALRWQQQLNLTAGRSGFVTFNQVNLEIGRASCRERV